MLLYIYTFSLWAIAGYTLCKGEYFILAIIIILWGYAYRIAYRVYLDSLENMEILQNQNKSLERTIKPPFKQN